MAEDLLRWLVVTAVLAGNALLDIRKKEISPGSAALLAVYGCVRSFMTCVNAGEAFTRMLPGLQPGLMMIGLSICCPVVGMGDGLLVTALGTILSLPDVLSLLAGGFLLCGLWAAGGRLLLKKEQAAELPFVPFLLAAWLWMSGTG